jgi:gas vesicle protein
MRNGFVKGIMIGGIVAASVGLMMNSDMMMSSRTKKRMMRGGRNLLRKSGNIISDVADLFR